VFTEENVKRMREIEEKILEMDGWVEYCFTGPQGRADPNADRARKDCQPGFNSVTNFFYPLYDNASNPVAYWGPESETRMADFDSVLRLMKPRPFTRPEFAAVPQFVDGNFKDTGKSEISRALFLFGLPLEGEDYEQSGDEYDAQKLEAQTWAREELWNLVAVEGSTDSMRVLHFGILTDMEYEERILFDMLLLIGTIFVIFCLIWTVSQSCFIAGMGMLQIMGTLPTALVLLVFVFRQTWIGILHLLAVFIILGIGADDIFGAKLSPCLPLSFGTQVFRLLTVN
jgi:hypothetical protein